MRHVDEPVVRSYAVTHPSGAMVIPQPNGWDQLLLTETGTMTVHTDDSSWLAPPHRAVWAPSGIHHSIHTDGRVRVRSLYIASGTVAHPGECRAVELTDFCRALVLRAVAAAPLWSHIDRDAHVVAVLADELSALDDAPLRLPMPADPRARHVALLLLDHPAEDRSVSELARDAATSRRTLERLFLDQTGMTVGRWRTQARVHAAVRLLAAGESVTRTAVDVGYSTPSAFGVAFRQVLGTSPGRYLHEGTSRVGR